MNPYFLYCVNHYCYHYCPYTTTTTTAGVCPFHYNHWSCDGMKGGGRDWTKNRYHTVLLYY